MNLDLSNLAEVGSSKNVKKQVNLPNVNYHKQEIELINPFELELDIYRTNDSYLLTGRFSGILILFCSRCLEKFEHKIDLKINEELLKDEIDDIEKIDLTDMLLENIVLSLPMKYLCSPDCKGLCPVCGQNLNEAECDCNTETIDPRLAKLKEFYKSDDDEE